MSEEQAWCLIVESKVLSPLKATQLLSHRVKARKRGFDTIHSMAIVPWDAIADDTVTMVQWQHVYLWLLRKAATSEWAKRAAAYFEIIEGKLVNTEQLKAGTLTTFTGFPFGSDHPYTYLEAKRLLGLAMTSLRADTRLTQKLGMNPALPGRGAITGRHAEAVWDFLSLARDETSFTNWPHLTLGINAKGVEAMVTVPNSVNRKTRNRIRDLGTEGFRQVLTAIYTEMAKTVLLVDGTAPWFRGIQRRYPSQRSVPFVDAQIDFDLRTAVGNDAGPKKQPRWLDAAFAAFDQREGSNYQIQVGVQFPYSRCTSIGDEKAVSHISAAWLACSPLTDLIESG